MNELLRIENLIVKYKIPSNLFEKKRFFYAVNSVSFKIMENETVGIVGESGSGKSTLAHSMLNLIKPSSGEIFYKGENISQFSKKEVKKFRKKVAIIFQDPYSSLNPRKTILNSITDAPIFHGIIKKEERINYSKFLLNEVGLSNNIIYKFPHEFSGGEKQRLSIARAIAMEPEFIVCDEPVSSLDLMAQAQILNLLKSIKNKRKISLLFISHDLSVIKYMADFVVVMYRGNIVECAQKNSILTDSRHPFTKLLLSSVPSFEEPSETKPFINRKLDSKELKGCNFFSRCDMAKKECQDKQPLYYNVGNNHFVKCHLFSKNGKGQKEL